MVAPAQVVLIGEPDPATRALYERMIGAAFDVVAAPDAGAFMELLHTQALAALVLEPELFGEDGPERMLAVSRLCAARRVPLVFCSTQDVRRQGMQLGAAACLLKPTLPAALLETLRGLIGAAPAGAAATQASTPSEEC